MRRRLRICQVWFLGLRCSARSAIRDLSDEKEESARDGAWKNGRLERRQEESCETHPEERCASARKAAPARWSKKKSNKGQAVLIPVPRLHLPGDQRQFS